MAVFKFTDAVILCDGLDLTGNTNSVSMEYSANELEVTTFGNSTVRRIAGLRDSKIDVEGFGDFTSTSPTYDLTQHGFVGADVITAIVPRGRAISTDVIANEAFISSRMGGMLKRGAKVGDAEPFTANFHGNSPFTKATTMASSAGTSTLTTGTGSIVQLGATTSSQSIYSQLHVFSIGGTSTPTITVTVKSAATGGFGSPTTRATFTARTTVGAQRIVVVGPVTDEYWRVDYTVSGTSPTFGFAAFVGIQ